ncbi:MAG TPA: ribose-5-phosphate isomerase, partial [Firmicutes bacterium]|nr:ribose-5-phosphate isomerase [Bacillota bacterium]
IKGIRAANCHDCYSAAMTRAHNNANILTLGQRVVGSELAAMIAKIFLSTAFEGGRHQRRLDKIAALEEEFGQ